MAIEDIFQIPENAREKFIDSNIIGKLPDVDKATVIKQVTEIVIDYDGWDMDAIAVLAYAAERGKFSEYLAKLKMHYSDSLCYVPPEARRIAQVAGAIRAEQFFLKCYTELGIKHHG